MKLLKPKERRTRNSLALAINNSDVASLEYFGITDEDMAKGIVYVKKLAHIRFNEKAFQYHPDTPSKSSKGPKKTGASFRMARARYNTIKNMTILPCPLDKLNRILELTDGYETYRRDNDYERITDWGAFHLV